MENAESVQILVNPIATTGSGRLNHSAMASFGKWLKSLRDIKAWKQRDLVERSGLSGFTVVKAEAAEAPDEISRTTLGKLASAFGKTGEEFLQMWKRGEDMYGNAIADEKLVNMSLPRELVDYLQREAENRKIPVYDLIAAMVDLALDEMGIDEKIKRKGGLRIAAKPKREAPK